MPKTSLNFLNGDIVQFDTGQNTGQIWYRPNLNLIQAKFKFDTGQITSRKNR